MNAIERGTPVRFTASLGAVLQRTVHTAIRFDGAVDPGQVGLYQEPTTISGESGWHIIQFGAWDVAATESDFEILR